MWFILLSQFTSYTVYFTLSVNYKVSERQQRTTTANALYLLSCKSVCDKELTPPPPFFPGLSLSEYIFCFKIYSKIQLISFIHTNACPYPVIVQSNFQQTVYVDNKSSSATHASCCYHIIFYRCGQEMC